MASIGWACGRGGRNGGAAVGAEGTLGRGLIVDVRPQRWAAATHSLIGLIADVRMATDHELSTPRACQQRPRAANGQMMGTGNRNKLNAPPACRTTGAPYQTEGSRSCGKRVRRWQRGRAPDLARPYRHCAEPSTTLRGGKLVERRGERYTHELQGAFVLTHSSASLSFVRAAPHRVHTNSGTVSFATPLLEAHRCVVASR